MTAIGGESSESRAMSSVFIGNIPGEVNEDQLKDLFSEVGAVLNFRLFCDKNTGKSLGFAFCEYKEPEIAVSAARNLGGFEMKGQPLRVDVATSEKCRQELERLQGSIVESISETSDSTPEKAPEEISKAVASLPAEQMFELMKQMKMCIENNPQEARNLLLQNPQLAYALLQAQVIMRIVDPEVALKILNRPSGVTVPTGTLNPETKSNIEQMPMISAMSEIPPSFPPGMPPVTSDPMVSSVAAPMPQIISNPHIRPTMVPAPVGPVMAPNPFPDQDLRTLGDQDLRQLPALGDRDMRASSVMVNDKDMRQPMGDQDFRSVVVPPTAPDNRPFDPRFRNIPGVDPNRAAAPNFDRARAVDPRTAYEARTSGPARVEDPRKASMSAAALHSGSRTVVRILTGVHLSPEENTQAGLKRNGRSISTRFASKKPAPEIPTPPEAVPNTKKASVKNSRLSAAGPALRNLGPAMSNNGVPHPAMGIPSGLAMAPEDQEKAALIMQVLQLPDQQIAMLPPEQRQSIMVLKEQLARSQLT